MNHMHFESKKRSQHFFWLIWIIYCLVYMAKTCFSAAMASIVFEGVMTKSQTGLITAVFYAVYAPLQIVGGFAADRYDPEKLIKIGLIGGGIANLILLFNQNYHVVLVVWVLNAIIQFGIWPGTFKIVSSQLAPEERKHATYYLSFNTAVGLMLSYLVAAIVPRWYYNFAVSAAVLFLSAFFLHITAKKVQPYMVPDEEVENTELNNTETVTEEISTNKLFLESGFYIILIVAFLRTVVLNGAKTLSATMLMESYEKVSPAIGNYLNIIIISVGIIGTVFVKTVLYPNIIKSAITGVAIMLSVTLISSIALLFIGEISISITLVSLCLMVGTLTAASLFVNYCNLRFAKFGKSGTVAGILNSVSSFGVVITSYGVTRVADNYGWITVGWLFLIMLAAAFGLSVAVIPFWKRFKKKYHANSPHPLASKT